MYFKLQIHNLEPAETESCKIAFVVFLTSIKKQSNNVEMVSIPLACMLFGSHRGAERGMESLEEATWGWGEAFLASHVRTPDTFPVKTFL